MTTALTPIADYLILITDRDLNVVGNPVVNWETIDVTLRHNEPDSGLFTAPGYAWLRDQVYPGNRVVVIRNGDIFTSGPIEGWFHERSDDGENAGDGKLTVNFGGDLTWIAGRLAYPNPALAADAQVTDSWTFTGNAELAMHALVNTNAGPGALTARRVPRLVMGAVAGVGSTVTAKTTLFEPVADVLRRIALDGGDLGFRTRQVGSQIEFQVFAPPDVSGSVRFGFQLGNMKYLGYEVQAPTVTAAHVGGQGDGADRFVTERIDGFGEAAWGRIEQLVSQPGNKPLAELQADGDEALADGGESARMASNVADTSTQQYGVHYEVGSRVAIESWPGEQYIDIVRTVHLQAWATAGEIFSPTVGSQAAVKDQAWVSRMRDIDRRLGRLERTVTSI